MDEKLIHEFLKARVPDYLKVEPLAGDASLRKYYRVHLHDRSLVLCHDSGFTEAAADEYPFIVIHKLLQSAGIPVPRIYTADPGKSIFLLEDAGDGLLEYMLSDFTENEINEIYKKIIDILIISQGITGTGGPFELAFDVDKLMFEFEFFIEHALLAYFNAGISHRERQLVHNEFVSIAQMLYRPDCFVFTHRDFHSRNIMLKEAELYIIDFQDARMGLPQYDLASLLRDSYVVLSRELFISLKDYYYTNSKEAGIHTMDRDEFEFLFDVQAFQRNVKALGTFGYQCAVMGNKKFERYIQPTVDYLGSYMLQRHELRQAGDILSRYMS